MTTLRYSKAGAKLAIAALLAGFSLAVAPLGAAEARPGKKPAVTAAAKVPPGAKKAKAGTRKAAKSVAKVKRQAAAEALDADAIAAKGDPQYTSAGPDDAGCVKQRRRLFVESEGWIVRRVTICP